MNILKAEINKKIVKKTFSIVNYLVNDIGSSFCFWSYSDSDLSERPKFSKNIIQLFCSNFIRQISDV